MVQKISLDELKAKDVNIVNEDNFPDMGSGRYEIRHKSIPKGDYKNAFYHIFDLEKNEVMGDLEPISETNYEGHLFIKRGSDI